MLNEHVLAAVLEFRRKRDWKQFHKPKELAAAISVEASELLEISMEIARRSDPSA